MLYSLFRPLLFMLPPEMAHTTSLKFLRFAQMLPCCVKGTPNSPVNVMGLQFPNRVGLAAGLDKNGDYITALLQLGFGFIEVGTVTPKPQPGNIKPRLFRLTQAEALINRLGFNNKGVHYLVENIKAAKEKGCSAILGVNIGKNRQTAIEDSIEDYLYCMKQVYRYADYITVNISSPNTPQLRSLQFGEHLSHLLKTLKLQQCAEEKAIGRYVPLVVKVSPDLTRAETKALALTCLQEKIDGIIATNTTLSRARVEGLHHANEVGGLSGKPLYDLSTQLLTWLAEDISEQIPIIAVGGIMHPEQAAAKITAGASLVQLYTGMIYRGPQLIRDVAQHLAELHPRFNTPE